MEDIDDPGASYATAAGIYFRLNLADIVASNLPRQDKTSHLVKTSRDLRVQVIIAATKYPRRWKPFAYQISWLEGDDMISHTAHKDSTVMFEVYAKFSHEDHQSILSSELMNVGALIERAKQNQKITIDLKPEFEPELFNSPVPTIAFSLSATPIVDSNRGDIKKVVLSKIGPRERWAKLVDPLQSIIRIGTGIAEVNSSAKIALSCVKVACETFLKPFEIDEKVLKLMSDVEAALRLVLEVDTEEAKDLTPVQKSLLCDLMRQANECILFMREYSKQSYLKIVGNALVKNYNTLIADYIRALRSLTQQFNNSELRDIQVVVHRLECRIQDFGRGVDILQLDRLEITKGAGRDPDKMCLKGTRISVLERVHTWIQGGGDGAKARLLLTVGQAGVGKSAIAHTIANEYFKMGRLGATFCFSKDRGSADLFRTIARNLADIDAVYASELSSLITTDAATSSSLQVQMEDILLAPFKKHPLIGPIVIVLDALDECADRNQFIDCLIKNIDSLPDNIRILMTSRPTEAQRLRNQPWVKVLDLEVEPPSDEDIFLYVQERLGSHLAESTPQGLKTTDLKDIASHSEGLFQYASVVCSEIVSSYHRDRRSRKRETPKKTFILLVKESKGGLDGLYGGILDGLYPGLETDSEDLEDFRSVMGWILTAQHRLNHDTLVEFGHFLNSFDSEDYDPVSTTLRPLGALLSGTQGGSATVYPLHSSIRNYLTDERRSGRFYIGSETEQHHSLASISLRFLAAPGRLRFNIANLETSYLGNRKVPDFEAQVSSAVSASLSYACTYWATHIRHSLIVPDEFNGLNDLATLVNRKFLFWLEVLALQENVDIAEDACQMLLLWLPKMCTAPPISMQRLNLCLKFVRDYHEIIEYATPHLYLSLLAQTPAILDMTLHQFTALPKVVRFEDTTKAGDHSINYMTLHGHTGKIYSVEFSRDGQYLVTASEDKTVRIWDTRTCSQVGDALTGHTDAVHSASFSPDGKLVVSTSNSDGSVRIWNAQSKAHEQVGDPFTRHNGVEKALFLPNGKHVTSASNDMILFWDAMTHTEIAHPLYNRGLAFAVSPNGNCIAIPIEDEHRTLEIRVIQTGARIGQLLTGHWGLVTAVAFSPDGQHIATSAYFDPTLQTWDVKTGALINVMDVTSDVNGIGHIAFYLDGRYLMTSGWHNVRFWDMNTHSQIQQGFSGELSGLDFAAMSSNGDRVASVSSDHSTIQLWSFDPFADHLTRTTAQDIELTSASYSPNGKHIAAACDDYSVRIWDAENCSQVGSPLIGHTDTVQSASFSPDGKLIVTASVDNTVRVWNAETGAQIGQPLTGHTGPIVSASFSPDGTYLLSADSSTIRVCSAGRCDLGKHIRTIKLTPAQTWWNDIQSVSFLPLGQLLVVDFSHYTQLLDLSTGSEAVIVPPEYRGTVVCFSSDEHLMLFSGSEDGNLHLWNTESCQIEKVFRGHTDAALKASFSPDGKYIVSASKDDTIRVWSTETGSQTAVYHNPGRFRNPGEFYSLKLKTIEVSLDGRRILSVYYNHKFTRGDHVQIWAMPDSLPPGTDLHHSVDIDDPNPWHRAGATIDGPASLVGHTTKDNQGQKNEILFCSVGDKRSLMWLPCHAGVLQPRIPPVRILWEDSVHGTDWTKCYLGESDS